VARGEITPNEFSSKMKGGKGIRGENGGLQGPLFGGEVSHRGSRSIRVIGEGKSGSDAASRIGRLGKLWVSD